jgi:hypothetical protein
VRSNAPDVLRVADSGSAEYRGRPTPADYYRSWHEAKDTERKTVLARIESGELPKTFQVTEHRYYVERRLPYLSPVRNAEEQC